MFLVNANVTICQPFSFTFVVTTTIDKSFSKILFGSHNAFYIFIHLNKVPIIPNVDLCRGYMFYGLGAHVVYANLNAAQIHEKKLIMTAVILILKANT